jgi:hypothetical protein
MKKIIQITFYWYTPLLLGAQMTTADSARYLSTPGPRNQDTTKFASFYVMRPDNTIDKNTWNAFFIDDHFMVKMENAMKCVIKCAATGPIKAWAKNDELSSIEINVEAGKKYYILMNIEAGPKHGFPKLVLLNEKEGALRYNSMNIPEFYVYDDHKQFSGPLIKSVLSSYMSYPSLTGFVEFLFQPPLSARHYFASAENGYRFMYNNKMLSSTFSELDFVQRMEDKDFDNEVQFEEYVKKHIEKAGKNLKKSETLQEQLFEKIHSPADMTYGVYSVTRDTKPENTGSLNGQSFLEVRTYQVCMYKTEVKKSKGRVFLISFSERGLLEELHSKEEIRFKINLLLNSSSFGKAGKTPLF